MSTFVSIEELQEEIKYLKEYNKRLVNEVWEYARKYADAEKFREATQGKYNIKLVECERCEGKGKGQVGIFKTFCLACDGKGKVYA